MFCQQLSLIHLVYEAAQAYLSQDYASEFLNDGPENQSYGDLKLTFDIDIYHGIRIESSILQVQHVFCLMGHIETKTFTDAHVPCLTEFSIKTFFNATCTLFPFSRKLTRRQERNKAHKVQTSQKKRRNQTKGIAVRRNRGKNGVQ